MLINTCQPERLVSCSLRTVGVKNAEPTMITKGYIARNARGLFWSTISKNGSLIDCITVGSSLSTKFRLATAMNRKSCVYK